MKKKNHRLFGILGYPLGHTLSPAMQEAAFQALGLNAFYLTFEVSPKELNVFHLGLKRSAIEGFNVTVPFKEKIYQKVARLTPEAKAIGAVNTVYRKGKQWHGTNTDAYGFAQSLKVDGKFNVKGKAVLIFGAGGSARAVLYAVLKQGARSVFIFNRHLKRAQSLKRRFTPLFPKAFMQAFPLDRKQLKVYLKKTDLIINTTSVGLKGKDASLVASSDIPKASGQNKKLFFDLIYQPAQTKLLKLAKDRGHRVVNGVGMLAYQGAKSFECWTGKKAPAALMRKVLEGALKK